MLETNDIELKEKEQNIQTVEINDIELKQKEQNVEINPNVFDILENERKKRGIRISHEHTIQLLSSITLMVGLALIIICSLTNDFNIYETSSFICSLFGIVFWVLLIYIVFIRTNELYAIKTMRRTNSNNAALFMVGETKKYSEKPMTSISAVIGLRGSNTEKLASSILYTMCGVCCMTFTTGLFQHHQYYQVNKENYNIYHELDIICGMTASFAIWLLATWQLEHNGGISDILHYFSGLIYVTCSFLSYIFQSNYSIFSIMLPVFSIISVCLFVIFGMFGCLETTPISIYWKSVILISCESTILLSVNIANLLALFHIKYL